MAPTPTATCTTPDDRPTPETTTVTVEVLWADDRIMSFDYTDQWNVDKEIEVLHWTQAIEELVEETDSVSRGRNPVRREPPSTAGSTALSVTSAFPNMRQVQSCFTDP